MQKESEPKPKTEENVDIKALLKDVFIIFLPFIFLQIVNFFFAIMNYGYWFPPIRIEGLFIEFILLYIACLILFSIVKKWKTVIIVSGMFLGILSVVNQIKYAFTGEPVLFSDLLFLGSSGEIAHIIEGDFWGNISWCILPLLIEIALIVFLSLIGIKHSDKFEIKDPKIRIYLASASTVLFILLIAPIEPINKAILNIIYHTNNRVDYIRLTETSQYYTVYGTIGGIYGQSLEDRITQPDDYNEEEVSQNLSNAKGNPNPTLGTPNIIVIVSESFWDIDKLSDVSFNKTVTANLAKLREKGLSFEMITPTYGGVSANVSYEFLTGNNVMFYNRGFIPYMQLYNNASYFDRPSIINELRNNGYKTKIVTASSPQLFSSGKFYNYLKVDEVEYLDNVDQENINGLYVSDKYLTDKVINYLDNKDKTEKLFYMTLTMEAHMPYPTNKYDHYDVNVVDSHYSNEINNTLTSYAQGLYNADAELGRLYEYIQNYNEPTIIVFYGDHLPYLYSGKDNAIDILEYFNTPDETLNQYRKYNTESLIVANFDLKNSDITIPSHLGPDTLGAYILNNMDIKLSDYYKWLYDSIDYLPTANHSVTVDADGKPHNTGMLTDELNKMYNNRKNIEYQLFVK